MLVEDARTQTLKTYQSLSERVGVFKNTSANRPEKCFAELEERIEAVLGRATQPEAEVATLRLIAETGTAPALTQLPFSVTMLRRHNPAPGYLATSRICAPERLPVCSFPGLFEDFKAE